MIKNTLLIAVMLLAGNTGWGLAQNTMVAAHKIPRFDIQDRIQYQRERVKEGLADKTITADHARYCLADLMVVENHLKHENLKNVNAMPQKEYGAYNKCLDANSAFIHESKQAFFYYDRFSIFKI
jgi:hypothetical protein